MRKKQQVCFRSGSAVAGGLGIAPETPGTVLCRYKISREGAVAPARLDVRFGRRVAWGVPEREFVSIAFSSLSRLLPRKCAQLAERRDHYAAVL